MSTGWATIAILAALALAAFAVVDHVLGRVHLARRINLSRGGSFRTSVEGIFTQRAADLRSGVDRSAAVLGKLMPLGEDDRRKIAVALRRAGYQSSNALTIVLGAKTACILVGLAVGVVVARPLFPGLLGWGAGVVAGLLVGVVLNLVPELTVARLAASRMRRIKAGLADAFDLLIVCLESGLTFERALNRTVSDLQAFQPDLAAELRQASLDMAAHGRTREDALGRLAGRLDSREFRDLAATVAQGERHGTPLAESVRKLASSFRVEVIATMQAKMTRLPILLVLPTLIFVLPGILIIVGGPAFVRMLETLGDVGG
ncbi:MAG: type II secretion system F family protein [Gammaproteobacteria bacterium]|nr:type II secretion system F family protein [Gammaproteobacteria bacterium]